MNTKARLFLSCITGALFIGAGPMVLEAHAQSAMPTTTMPAAEPIPYWWFSGEIEAGGRFFLNNPQKDGIASQGGKSLAKFYEYRDLRPGPFGNAHLATGTSNGLYQFDVWGDNIGYNDQRFDLRASKAGEHYFNFEWDQTPHIYGFGQTIYNGVGSNALTLPAGLSNTLFTLSGNTDPASNTNLIQSTLNANSHQIEIGIRRDTADVEYRWTPTDVWDIRFNYALMHRWGTQVDGVVFSPSQSGVVSQVPKPVDDITQNFGMNGEYAGTSPWGKKFTFKVGYSGSIYQDRNKSYTVENPFCPTGAVGTTCANVTAPSSPIALMSMWPNNQANGFNATLRADLPWKSRYVGNVSYNMMRQNNDFLPFTANTALVGVPALPAASLNGNINTLLSNNVLTTQLTPDLKSILSYRVYDFANNTPELSFPNWVLTDAVLFGPFDPDWSPTSPMHSISISYTKQNAGAELNWRPIQDWNLGAAYGYERYAWTRADVNATNENSGRVYADWKPEDWFTTRASLIYSARRYENYDYAGYVGNFQWPLGGVNSPPFTQYSTAMRQFYLDNRNRTKGKLSIDFGFSDELTITPTFGYQDDVYDIPDGLLGLTRRQGWSAGVELAYVVNPSTTLLFAYMKEQYMQNLRASTTNTVPSPPANTYGTEIKDNINTFMGAIKVVAIPTTLDLQLAYTVSLATDSQPVHFADGTTPTFDGQYPDVKTTWQRIDATAKYTFDRDMVRNLGLKGEMFAKLAYTWERNSSANWQNDIMQNYLPASQNNSYGYMTWLAHDNPNYNVHLIRITLGVKW